MERLNKRRCMIGYMQETDHACESAYANLPWPSITDLIHSIRIYAAYDLSFHR